MKFIYDNQLPTLYLSSSADATEVTNTLVLQSYDHQKVPVLLEFINNSGVDFKGQDGIVYQGTKFYLAGEVDPADGTGGDICRWPCVHTRPHDHTEYESNQFGKSLQCGTQPAVTTTRIRYPTGVMDIDNT